MPRLNIQERGREKSWVHECAEDEITIGRMDSNSVQLKSHGVSREHAKIVKDGELFFLIDLKSGNGTQLNGAPLAPSEKNLLQAGDVITIENFDLRFHESGDPIRDNLEEEVTDSDILEVKLLKKVLTALDKETVPSIEVLNGTAEGKKIFLTDEISDIVVGRDPDCDFPINEYVMSRRHARIVKRWGGITVRDLESKNGTFVNNRRVVEEFLHDGDRLALGTIVMMFRNPQELNLAQLSDVKPKNRPAAVRPEDIPGIEEGPKEAPEGEPSEAEEPAPETEESGAVEEWNKLEQSLSGLPTYPTPEAHVEAIKRLTPIEIGMIGLGALVLIFALITIVNLLKS